VDAGPRTADEKRSRRRRPAATRTPPELLAGPATFVTDATGRVVATTPAFCVLVGRRPEQVLGQQQPYPWWPEGQHRWLRAQLGARLESAAGRARFEGQHVAADGRVFAVMGTVTLLLDEVGGAGDLLWSIEPREAAAGAVDARDRTVDATTAATGSGGTALERALRRLCASDLIGIITGRQDRILTANDAFLELIGRSRAELEVGGIDWPAITPPEWLEVDALAGEQMVRDGVSGPIEKEYLRPDGSRVAVRIAGAVIDVDPLRWVSFVEPIEAADPAVVQLLRRREVAAERREADFLRALETRDVIGRAKGILMARWHVDADRAFEMLRLLSMRTNRKVVDIARELTDHPEPR
jgi:PAS domain S-box-containing protein